MELYLHSPVCLYDTCGDIFVLTFLFVKQCDIKCTTFFMFIINSIEIFVNTTLIM